jgi:hypothetical protein
MNYCLLFTAYSLLELSGSKETTPPSPGSISSPRVAEKLRFYLPSVLICRYSPKTCLRVSQISPRVA